MRRLAPALDAHTEWLGSGRGKMAARSAGQLAVASAGLVAAGASRGPLRLRLLVRQRQRQQRRTNERPTMSGRDAAVTPAADGAAVEGGSSSSSSADWSAAQASETKNERCVCCRCTKGTKQSSSKTGPLLQLTHARTDTRTDARTDRRARTDSP